MKNVAILGFGVVGGGVAKLITDNKREVEALGGDEVQIKYILDLRDFPNSPFADRVVHDYDIIADDAEIDTVIEVMGGSHPAYEYTVRALRAGKNVITSNKEVVARYGDEFLAIAKETGVSYRFEAAVGGGIPVISPLIGCVCQNKIREVRGILNGTTNYILTKMFTLGDSFENALADAQAKGYAERNPDADILGTDAARKIAILAAIVTGKLIPTEEIHTEGITGVRHEDVVAAETLGMKIKLLGRCTVSDEGIYVMVAPFMLSPDKALAGVAGVYNAVEVIGDPIDSVMFYGPGAGAGPTASAVVGDLVQVMRSGRACKNPEFTKTVGGVSSFSTYTGRTYLAFEGVSDEAVKKCFGDVQRIITESEYAFVAPTMSEAECDAAIEKAVALGATLKSRIRLLGGAV